MPTNEENIHVCKQKKPKYVLHFGILFGNIAAGDAVQHILFSFVESWWKNYTEIDPKSQI